jgi:hypothetical protein
MVFDDVYEKCTYTLDEILEYPMKVKKKGSLFNNYKTSYPFEKDIAEKEFEWITNNYGKLMIYEAMFLWFSNYFPLYSQTFQALMCEEGTIPDTWRYYIAIMVRDIFT